MRWKAFFFERNEDEDQDELNDEQNNQDHKYGFKSKKCPPQIEDMEKFEDDLLEMVKKKNTFVIFDIDSFFYPLISENLLKNAISYTKQYVTVTDQEVDIIMHSRKSLLFDQGTAWIKKNDDGLFDVTMGSYDGAEVCELVGLLILDQLGNQYGKKMSAYTEMTP